MNLPSPCLDDRTFDDLLRDARKRLHQACPDWSDASAADPGIVLLELFAYLTDQLIYRLNRLPDKVYIEFLRLMGVRLNPPGAARVQLTFTRTAGLDQPLTIRRGTRVTCQRADAGSEAPIFTTLRDGVFAAGAGETTIEAGHCLLVEGEDAGGASGLAGARVVADHAPVILPTGDDLDLLVGIECTPDELPAGAAAIRHGDASYRVWREVDDFTGHAADAPVFIADRMSGEIQFAPAARLRDAQGRLKVRPEALAGVPPAERRIRLWYRHGGGLDGNLAAGRLNVLKDPIPGVSVVNRQPATGGSPAETLDNALVRGPNEFYSLKRAVTASDYELIACATGVASRARAFARAELYRYAQPGTVEVLLVPPLGQDPATDEAISSESLTGRQSADACRTVADALADCRPLGAGCVVNWARAKTVQVRMRVVVQNQLDTAAVKRDILSTLRRRLNPLPMPPFQGWEFGEAVRASHLYDLVLKRPGIGYVDQLTLVVDEVPEARVTALAVDAFQPRCWYAAAADRLFVSEDDGDGWQLLGRFADERVVQVAAHRSIPGLLAVVTALPSGSHLLVSRDAGQTWISRARTAFTIVSMAWAQRDGAALLFLATSVGLYEIDDEERAVPTQLIVDPARQDLGFFSVAVNSERGVLTVMAAAAALGGVFISTQGGASSSFRALGLAGEDVRVLAVSRDGPRAFLWVGLAAVGNENGKGCLCQELRGESQATVEGWRWANKGWTGGSVYGLAFDGQQVFAASHRAGVLMLETAKADPLWQAPSVDCGLPLRDIGRLHPVEAIALDPRSALLMCGGLQGVYRAQQQSRGRFEHCSRKEFTDKVTVPATWLLMSGDHQVTVLTYDELREQEHGP